MAKYLRLFQTVAEKEAATLDYPNVNYTIENDSIEILESAPVPPVAFGGLTVKYNIADPTVEVTLFKGGGGSSSSSSSSSSESGSGGGGVMPTRMIVDGNEETPINTWRFETAGEHVVQYEFEDNVIPGGFMADGEIPATEAIIGDDITEISFDSETNIGAFTNSTLTTATIGNGVTTIGQDAFVGCMSLTSVTIGTGITTIGDSAFADSNHSLASVTVNATTPPTLGGGAFNSAASNFVIYVPATSVNDYKGDSDWYEYALQIQPIS
jgi:hypothetical protein